MADLFERYFFDAMANLGQSLGQRSADNAVKRQSLKARSAIDNLLGSANEADVTAAMRGSQGQRYDLSRGTIVDPQYSLSNATPDGRNVQENAADEVLNLKRMGRYPILDKMVKNGEQQVNLLQNNGWQPPLAIEDVKLALRKQGVDEDIIEKELGYYGSKIKEQANATFVPQILDKYKNGDYTGAMQDTLALRQYDPDTANVLLSGSVTPRDLYASGQEDVKYSRNRSDKLADREQQHIWDLEAEYRKINTAKDMSLFNVKLERAARNWALEDKLAFVQRNPDAAGVVFGRSSGSNGSKTIFDSGAFKAANEQLKVLNEKIAIGGELTTEEKQRFDQSNAIVNGAFASFFQPDDKPENNNGGLNLNDYSTAIKFGTEIKEKAAGRIPNEQIAGAIREEYGLAANDTSNDFVEKILNDLQLVGTPARAKTQPQAPQEKPWWDRTERTGAAAMSFDDIKRAIVENARNNPVGYRR